MTNSTAMAKDSTQFSFSASSLFQENSKRVPVNNNHKNTSNQKSRLGRHVGHKRHIPDETTPFSFNIGAGMPTSSPGVFNYGSQSSTAVEKVGEPQQKQAIQQEESDKSLPLILVSRVMNGVPQSPHYWPLRDCSDLAKGILIDAWDRVFEESAEKIQNMEGDGLFVEGKKLWKTLEELQGMGYNVIVLRRRLIELTQVLMEKRRFKREIVGLMERAEFHRMEKNRLEYEILQIKARVEAENMRFDDLVGSVEKMEVELNGFDAVFGSLVIKSIGASSD